MSSHPSLKWGMKKYSRNASRRKSSMNLDLNSPPPTLAVTEDRPPEENCVAAQGAAAATGEPNFAGMASSPINVDEIEDDDVQMLSSPRGFLQARNQSRGIRQMMVVLDEDQGSSNGNSDDHFLGMPLSSFRRCHGPSPNREIINCEAYGNVYNDQSVKKKASIRRNKPEKPVPEEPDFKCPICRNSLVNACSTVCGHVFCQECIRQAIKSQKKCPTCRRKLIMSSFHRLYLPATT